MIGVCCQQWGKYRIDLPASGHPVFVILTVYEELRKWGVRETVCHLSVNPPVVLRNTNTYYLWVTMRRHSDPTHLFHPDRVRHGLDCTGTAPVLPRVILTLRQYTWLGWLLHRNILFIFPIVYSIGNFCKLHVLCNFLMYKYDYANGLRFKWIWTFEPGSLTLCERGAANLV